MNDNDYEVKYQACNLSDALHRNVNDNFESVSFRLLNDGHIDLRIVLKSRTYTEDEYIEDITVEFSALQSTNCVNRAEILVGKNNYPLENIVYKTI